MPVTVYRIVGCTDTHNSDHYCQWEVAAYFDEGMAEQHLKKCQKDAERRENLSWAERSRFESVWDLLMHLESNPRFGVKYYLAWNEVYSHIDEYIEERTRQ